MLFHLPLRNISILLINLHPMSIPMYQLPIAIDLPVVCWWILTVYEYFLYSKCLEMPK